MWRVTRAGRLTPKNIERVRVEWRRAPDDGDARKLTVVVGDEHGLLTHIHIPTVFASPPRKPEKLRPPPRELGDAGPRPTLDPTLVARNQAEFAAWKAQMGKLKPRITRMNGVEHMLRANGVDDLFVHPTGDSLVVGRHNGVVERWALPRGRSGRAPDADGMPLLTAKLQDFGLGASPWWELRQ